MNNKKKLMITGGSGLVGSAVMSLEKDYPEFQFRPIYHSYGNLTDQNFVDAIFDIERPDIVLHLAARVGGIGKNLNQPADQFDDNILMNTFVIQNSLKYKVEKFIGFGSVCAFPQELDILTEESYLEGEPFPAHKSYAYAKRMMTVQLEAYKQQFGFNSCSIIPTNIFGTNDSYNLENGHVIPVLIHKFYNAIKDITNVECWGSGTPLREFIFAEDLAKICLDLLSGRINPMPDRLIIPGQEYAIRDIVDKMDLIFMNEYKYPVEFPDLVWNKNKPNGQMVRKTGSIYFNNLFPNFKPTDVDFALRKSIKWFIENYPNVRK